MATRVPTVWGHPIKLEQYEEITPTLSHIFSFSQLMEHGYGDSEGRKLGSIKVIEKESEFAMFQYVGLCF